jgi:hypothetical protein
VSGQWQENAVAPDSKPLACARRLLEQEEHAESQRVRVGAFTFGIPANNVFLVKFSYWLNL